MKMELRYAAVASRGRCEPFQLSLTPGANEASDGYEAATAGAAAVPVGDGARASACAAAGSGRVPVAVCVYNTFPARPRRAARLARREQRAYERHTPPLDTDSCTDCDST